MRVTCKHVTHENILLFSNLRAFRTSGLSSTHGYLATLQITIILIELYMNVFKYMIFRINVRIKVQMKFNLNLYIHFLRTECNLLFMNN